MATNIILVLKSRIHILYLHKKFSLPNWKYNNNYNNIPISAPSSMHFNAIVKINMVDMYVK